MAQQLFMIEIMFDKISVYVREDDTDQNTDKGFIIKLIFGPNDDTNFKENHLAEVTRKEAVVACDDTQYDKTWNRNIRVGKSFLFPGYPDMLVNTLGKFPIEVTLWTDGKNEKPNELIGNGSVKWDPKFYAYLKENDNPKILHEPFTVKQTITVYHDTLPGRAAELDVILRLSALGESITTEFQQDPEKESFVFRTNKVPTMFFCERTQGDDINFLMVGNVYETLTLEDPNVIAAMNQKIEVCTELDSCKPHEDGDVDRIPVEYPIDKIKMKDIVGPCGNNNCPLAHKIKTYLRALEYYKEASKGKSFPDKNLQGPKNVCGSCGCQEDRWHRDTCPELDKKPVSVGCGGIARSGETCEDRIKRVNTKTDKGKESNKDKQVNYLTSIARNPEQKQSIFGQTFNLYPCEIKYENISTSMPPRKYCSCGQSTDLNILDQIYNSSRSMANVSALVYQADVKSEGKTDGKDGKSITKFCTDIPEDKFKECLCNPPVPTPPCKTFDCECLLKAKERETRRVHKSYCPAYKHKPTCPVQRMNDEENPEQLEEEEVEKLPYGLPPVTVGPCPVIGRPCSVPDGFSRMYRSAALPNQPLSYSDAGKVCCSQEFNRIKKAILEYMKAHEKEDDYRCINKFNWDTDVKRCCDKEQRLLGLIGKSCCGSNKPADNKNKKK